MFGSLSIHVVGTNPCVHTACARVLWFAQLILWYSPSDSELVVKCAVYSLERGKNTVAFVFIFIFAIII
jgi:hypothetical protein